MSLPYATLDFSPAPGAAPAVRRVLRHAGIETRLLLRNGEQLLLALVIPIGLLVGGHLLGRRWISLDVLAPSVLALAVWSSSFTSLAIATGFERRYGVLERLASTPLGRTGLLLGKALSIATIAAVQTLVLGSIALILGWHPATRVLPHVVAALTLVIGAVCFASWALVMAGALRAEITLGLANLVYLLGVTVGGIMIPPALFGPTGAAIISWLPTAAVADALRAASAGIVPPFPAVVLPLVVVSVWAALGVLVARKVFRWTA